MLCSGRRLALQLQRSRTGSSVLTNCCTVATTSTAGASRLSRIAGPPPLRSGFDPATSTFCAQVNEHFGTPEWREQRFPRAIPRSGSKGG
jgi:hypothetical protein